MSSVKIQGSATGTAAFTIAVPDGTSTDRTIELPDAAGSFVTADATGDVTVTGDLTVDTDTLYVDSANNRVGVGTTAPTSEIHAASSAASVSPLLTLQNTNTGAYGSGVSFRSYGASSYGDFETARISTLVGVDDGYLVFSTANNDVMTEAARIDNNGTFCIGKTTTSFDDSGINIFGYGPSANQERINVTRSGGVPLNLNRLSSDGSIIRVFKDGTEVGSIGNASTALYITNGATTGIKFGTNAFYATNGAGTNVDNSKDVGTSGVRFDDVYATSGVVNTSDATEKQQIASLTDAEISAAKAISKLFKTYKWNSSVEAKGDAARTHTGVVAQEVEQAMTDAGLDVGNYGFFIRGIWWETQTEVPAVEAVDEVVDEDGNVVTEAVEAQEAYTRTDIYDTLEEAPAGATQRTRLGIRYPELLSFISAATEQRLASIEARLDALEAV